MYFYVIIFTNVYQRVCIICKIIDARDKIFSFPMLKIICQGDGSPVTPFGICAKNARRGSPFGR